MPLCTLPSRFYEKFSGRELRKNELQVCALNHTRANYNFSIAHWDDRLKLIEKRNLAKEDGFRQWHFKIDIKIVPHFARSKQNLYVLLYSAYSKSKVRLIQMLHTNACHLWTDIFVFFYDRNSDDHTSVLNSVALYVNYSHPVSWVTNPFTSTSFYIFFSYTRLWCHLLV